MCIRDSDAWNPGTGGIAGLSHRGKHNMLTHEIDVEAQIHFRPETQHMTISFSGGECAGMPPFSNELLDLARGAHRVTFDLRELRLTNPDAVSYTHLRAHETVLDLVCRLLLEKKK